MKNRLGWFIFGLVLAGSAATACGSDDSSDSSKASPSDRAGCNAFCEAQAKLECGMPLATCYGLCKQSASQVPAQCKTLDDTLESCQANNLSCSDPSTLQIDGCTSETAAYSQCQTGGDAGTD